MARYVKIKTEQKGAEQLAYRPNFVTINGKITPVADVKQPKYTFGEAMGLANYGYTGLYGRSKTKKTVGLMGENWQQAVALSRYRRNKALPEYQLFEQTPREVLLDTAAATQLIPGKPQYNSLLQLYTDFAEKYGADASGFVKRYGNMPSKEGKYGVLFDLNNRKIRNDDVRGTYQNNLAKSLIKAGQAMSADNMPDTDKAIGIELKDSYFKQAKINMTHAEKRFAAATEQQDSLFTE